MAEGLTKDPNSLLDYGFDWAPWLAGDTITESTWTATGGLEVVENRSEHTLMATTVWVQGGTEGRSCSLTNRIVTAAGRRDERTLFVLVKQK